MRWGEITGNTEVKKLEKGMNFRLPQYRREVFLRFYEFHLKYRAHPGAVYYLLPHFSSGLGMRDRLWLAYINGCTQHMPTTCIIFQQFPDPRNLDGLDEWFNDNWGNLQWDMDRRYQKKEFPACARWFAKTMGDDPQKFFLDMMVGAKEKASFDNMWKIVRSIFPTFGRLSAFSYLEYLRIIGVPINCSNLFLEDMDGSKSHRNGLALVLGRDDLDWHKSNPSFKGYKAGEVDWLTQEAETLLEEAQERLKDREYIHDVNYFTLESALCTYKSWHRPNRRYPNVYNDMMHDRIRWMEKRWPNDHILFNQFWFARRLFLPDYLRLEDNPGDPGLSKPKQNHYLQTGQVPMMDIDWECFENDFIHNTKSVGLRQVGIASPTGER